MMNLELEMMAPDPDDNPWKKGAVVSIPTQPRTYNQLPTGTPNLEPTTTYIRDLCAMLCTTS